MIEEDRKIHAKEKLNILVSDHYGFKVARFFEKNDLLTNFEDSKKLHKALKLAAEATKKEKRVKFGVQGYSNQTRFKSNFPLINSNLYPSSNFYPSSYNPIQIPFFHDHNCMSYGAFGDKASNCVMTKPISPIFPSLMTIMRPPNPF